MAKGIIINRDLAREMAPGWEQVVLDNGSVLTMRGAFLLDIEGIHNAFSSNGEIEFLRCKGASADFVEKLKRVCQAITRD